MISLLLAAVITLNPCEVRGVKARCTAVTVPENPSRPAVRTIRLDVAVLPAEEKRDDALFILAGGPGVPATNMIGWAQRTFGPAGRDIVLVDARGTGRSNPLRCNAGGAPPPFADLMDSARLTACRDQLAAKGDLTQYTTVHIVNDLEAVRKVLGYTQVTLYGTSYGTRVAQEYMRRYPDAVQAVILDGVVPPSFAMPAHYAEYAQRSMKKVFELCRADEACHKAYPDLDADLAKMLKDADDGVTIGGATMKRGFFGEAFRNFLYSSEVYPRLPLVVHAAAKGDWAPFDEMATRYSRGVAGLDLGMLLSVSCAEDLPRVNEAAVRAGAKGTVLGTYRLDQQLAACKIWPRGTVDAEMGKPVTSAIPTLIVSGELDPVTPPEYGDEVAKTLKNALHVVIPYGSHSGDTGGCLEKVMTEFIRESSVAALDTACMKNVPRPQFVTSASKE